jgi:hypothetical protein
MYQRKMPQEGSQNSFFTSPSKKGLKGLVSMNMKEASSPAIEESFNDYDFAHRKAEEAGEYMFFSFYNTILTITNCSLLCA